MPQPPLTRPLEATTPPDLQQGIGTPAQKHAFLMYVRLTCTLHKRYASEATSDTDVYLKHVHVTVGGVVLGVTELTGVKFRRWRH